LSKKDRKNNSYNDSPIRAAPTATSVLSEREEAVVPSSSRPGSPSVGSQRAVSLRERQKEPSGRGEIDHFLLFITLCLLAVGITMVYSSSNMIGHEKYKGDSFHFLKTQLIACVIGLIGMAVASWFPYKRYRDIAKPMLIFSGVLLLFVYVPGIGHRIGGFRRWIKIFGFQFQPVELAKITLIIFVAYQLSRNGEQIRRLFSGVLPYMLVLSVFFLLIYKQPDFGTAVLISAIVLLMLFIGGARISQLLLIGIIACFIIYAAIQQDEYKLGRWEAFWNTTGEAEHLKNYQVWQSKNALAAGSLLGVGIGNSIYKLFYLPYPHTDFIFSILGEELGFIGVVAVIALFMVLIWRAAYVSLHVPDKFGHLIAMGICLLLGLQTLINIGVVVGVLPTKGLTLPFISYGGSSLMMSLIAVGILLNISREIKV